MIVLNLLKETHMFPFFKEVLKLKDCPMHGKKSYSHAVFQFSFSYSSFWLTYIIYFDL